MSRPHLDPVHGADLVVLSHLRWPWVWQRPQHLISRLAAERRAGGGRARIVEGAVGARGARGPPLPPSGGEAPHYARPRQLRRPHPVPVAGYVGVLDERIDLELL